MRVLENRFDLDNIVVVKKGSEVHPPVADRADDAVGTGPTRERLLRLLMSRGPLTAAELADALAITTVAVRRHLTALTEAGDIEMRDQTRARGRGRPAKEYLLTAQGRREFGQAYDALAISALEELAALAGPDAIGRLAEQRLAEVESEYRARRDADPDADPVELLAQCLNDSGHFASVPDDGELCQHHCPVSQVAAQFPELCAAETRLFAKLLGGDLLLTESIAHGDTACRVHLNAPTLLPDPTTKKEK